MTLSKIVFSTALMLISTSSFALVCENENGVPTDIHYDLSNVFNSSNNAVGQIVTLTDKSNDVAVRAKCPKKTGGTKYTYRSYTTTLQHKGVDAEGYQYLELNEYLDGAMSIKDSYAGIFYPPQEYKQMGEHPNVPKGTSFPVKDSNLIFKLRVNKRFVNFVAIPRQTIFTVYVTTSNSAALSTPVYIISYSGYIQVPQNCEINAGQIVTFNFGDMAASAFKAAGAGNRPQSVTPQTKTVGIKCTNIEAEAYLSLSLEANAVSGNIMVSDNPDLGFIVADNSGIPLTPNNHDSNIDFQLNDAGRSEVTIRAWPVSITGNKPSEGPFTARGYLRVEYD